MELADAGAAIRTVIDALITAAGDETANCFAPKPAGFDGRGFALPGMRVAML